MKIEKGKVYYICFYSETEVEAEIITYPSVISKIDYVIDTIKRLQKEVVVVSIAPARKGSFRGYSKTVDALESHVYLPSCVSTNRYLSRLYFMKHMTTILDYLRRNVKKGDKVLVYHSLYNRLWLGIYSCLFPDSVILQIEDVFSELSERTRRFKKTEWKLLKRMRKCICVNDILYRELSSVPQKMISYGSYLLPPQYDVQDHSAVRLVYAGVIEQERQAAFLAVKAMRHLTQKYELHILGFGNEDNIEALERLIREINAELERTAITFHGRLSGEAYWRFLQGCDVALSTHAYDASSFASADYTFPSKVLTYMANGLRVVAQRLEVLESSKIREFIHFYDTPHPEEIAKTILSLDNASASDPRASIAQLDARFAEEMRMLLEADR